MIELTPSTEAVADLLIRMTQLEWPTTESDRLRYFDILGLRDQEVLPPSDDDPESLWIRFTTSLPGQVDGNCSMFRGEFLGLSLFPYTEPVENGPQARAGYVGLRNHLSTAIGDPVEEWGSASEPACLWKSGLLMLEMYCFQRLASGVMVGPSHTERTAANDEAHIQSADTAESGSN
jgi:hypothetical protein